MNDQEFVDLDVVEQEQPKSQFCSKCGARIEDGQLFCPKCGKQVGTKLSESEKGGRGSKKKIIILLSGVAVAIVAIVLIVFAVRGKQVDGVALNKSELPLKVDETYELTYVINPSDAKNKEVTWSSSNDSIASVNNGVVRGINEGDCTITVSSKNGMTDTCNVTVSPAGPNFLEIYSEYCTSVFADVGTDGSYLSIDTNPSDDDDYTDYDALSAIFSVNEALGLPESVIEQMGHTSALSGTQSYSTDEIEVRWSYHPDNGLEITYMRK